jgi:hypothetical protein
VPVPALRRRALARAHDEDADGGREERARRRRPAACCRRRSSSCCFCGRRRLEQQPHERRRQRRPRRPRRGRQRARERERRARVDGLRRRHGLAVEQDELAAGVARRTAAARRGQDEPLDEAPRRRDADGLHEQGRRHWRATRATATAGVAHCRGGGGGGAHRDVRAGAANGRDASVQRRPGAGAAGRPLAAHDDAAQQAGHHRAGRASGPHVHREPRNGTRAHFPRRGHQHRPVAVGRRARPPRRATSGARHVT